MKRLLKNVISSLLMITILMGLVSYAAPTVAVKASGATMQLYVKHPEMNTLKLSWTKLNNAYGYKIYYKESASATYELVSETLDNVIVFDSLKTDKFYYFKVDAYNVVNGRQEVVGTTGDQKVRSNKLGIDVSKWNNDNGKIDWNKVKNYGMEYVIVRVAAGTYAGNEQRYRENIEGAQKAGIPVGVYIYSKATTTSAAKKEADYVLSIIKGYNLQYPVAFDIEDKVHKADNENDSNQVKARKKENTKLTKAFCDRIKAAGYQTMIYTGCSFSRTYLDLSQLGGNDLWIAHYGSTSKYTCYNGSYHYSCKTKPKTRIWQYTSCARVDGIKGNVDMNYELDLNESVQGMPHYNVSTKLETYVAGNGESLSSIADKYNISVQQLIKYDRNYQTSSWIGRGSTITIDSTYLSSNGKRVSNVYNVGTTVNEYDTVTVSWSPVTYSDGYYVYRSDQWWGDYKKVATVNGTSYRDSGLNSGQHYYYRIYAFKQNESGFITSPDATTVDVLPKQQTPSGLRVSATTYNSVKLSWNRSSNASYYKVYVATSKNGKYRKAGNTNSTSFKHKKLKYNQKYYYKVLAVRQVNGREYMSDLTGSVKGKPVLEQTNLKSVKAGSRKATVKWSGVSGAKGYMVYRSTSKNSGYKKVATVKSTTFKNYGLTRKKKYYYKVRAYRVVNGKTVYGAYSSPKKVKVY